MQEFTYKGIYRICIVLRQVCGLTAIIIFTVIAGGLVMGISTLPQRGAVNNIANDPRITLFCLAIWCLLISWVIGIALINVSPNIWVINDGLIISAFLFLRILIPWSEIIDIGHGRAPFGYTLVRARRISIFHRVFGWLYSRSLFPSFLIGNNISEYDILVHEINEKINHD
jgi:hypothetical protein